MVASIKWPSIAVAEVSSYIEFSSFKIVNCAKTTDADYTWYILAANFEYNYR
jgi:hypothetical protein